MHVREKEILRNCLSDREIKKVESRGKERRKGEVIILLFFFFSEEISWFLHSKGQILDEANEDNLKERKY